MGALFSLLWQRLFGHTQYKICIIGLSSAGKTTILYRFHLGATVKTQPTIGCNIEEVVYKNLHFIMFDLGGQETLRRAWNLYFINTNAIILVIDSSDREKLPLVKEELFHLVSNHDLQSSSLLIFANKQDLPGAMRAAEIVQLLDLPSIIIPYNIAPSIAITGEGIYEGLDWIVKQLNK